MKSSDEIERLVKNTRVTTCKSVDDRILGDAKIAFLESTESGTMSVQSNFSVWRLIMKSRITKFAAAVVILITILIGINQFGGSIDGASEEFAQVLEQIKKGKTMKWKTTFYSHVTSKDEKRMWIETEIRSCAYRVPGLYRQEYLDNNLQIHRVTVTDVIQRKELSLNPEKKEATLSVLTSGEYDLRGPFIWVQNQMQKRNLEWVGKKKTATGDANVFRAAFKDEANNQDWSYDFWIDEKTKQLIAVHCPGADIYDPEKDPARKNLPEKEWSQKMPMGFIQHDISFNTELDEAMFSFEPPEGYTLQGDIRRPQVTEKEMVEYLGILADYNDRAFPDQVFPFSFSSDRLNKITDKAKEVRTAAEQKLLETLDYYKRAGLNMMPTGHFVEDHTVEKSFRYLGKGVKLGDKDRIVCWYKLNGADTYRVVYGDLSIKDVAPEDLPLLVER